MIELEMFRITRIFFSNSCGTNRLCHKVRFKQFPSAYRYWAGDDTQVYTFITELKWSSFGDDVDATELNRRVW